MEPQEIAPATENNDSEIIVGAPRPTETAEPKEEGGADEGAAVEDKVELGMASRVTGTEEGLGDVSGYNNCRKLGCYILTRLGDYCTSHMKLAKNNTEGNETPPTGDVSINMDSHANLVSNQTNNGLDADQGRELKLLLHLFRLLLDINILKYLSLILYV